MDSDYAAQEYQPLRLAVASALHARGLSILENPKAFMGWLLDVLDPDTDQARVMSRNCDEEFLTIYVEAAKGRTPQSVELAASRALYHLEHERLIRREAADRVTCEMAFAMAGYLGLECPERVRDVAVHGARGQRSGGTTNDDAGRRAGDGGAEASLYPEKNSQQTLSQAVETALRIDKTVFRSPRVLWGFLSDFVDPGSEELKLLERNLDDEFLRPYVELLDGNATLDTASSRAASILMHDRVLHEDASRRVAEGIARGVAAHLGVELPQDPNGRNGRDQTGWNRTTRTIIERTRAVLSDAGATEVDVASALAAVRALPAGTMGRTSLESALERRLTKLVKGREADKARRAEEERRHREAEERDRLLAQEEKDRPRDATSVVPASNLDPNPSSSKRGVTVVLAVVACLVVAVVLLTNSWAADTKTVSIPTVAVPDISDFEPESAIGEYSWAELKAISNAIASAKSDKEGLEIAKQYSLVGSDGRLRGDTKVVTFADGTMTSVRILGFRHDELAGSGKSGITFEFADVPAAHGMNDKWTNEGGWEKSEMREWLNLDFLALLPDDLRGCVELATKRTNNKGHVKNEDDTSVVTETSDRLWLLSIGEVYGTLSDQANNVPYSAATYDAEGAQYQLYSDRGVTTSNHGFCKKGGALSWWWLRSPVANRDFSFLAVSYVGIWNYDNADSADGVSPGFCF